MLDPQSPVIRKLKNWQAQLLDLSRANRLLYFKIDRASSIPITLPEPADLFQQLVTRGKQLIFPLTDEQTLFDLDQAEVDNTRVSDGVMASTATSPDKREASEQSAPAIAEMASSPIAPNAIAQPEPGPDSTPVGPRNEAEPSQPESSAISRKRLTSEIGTSLPDQRLSRALYNLRARSRAAMEEQGVNVLFVAFGMLHWIDPETKEAVQSPLLLVPASLNREALRKPYTLSMLEDDIVVNPTLAYKLDTDFAIRLPDVPDDIETIGLAAYLEQIRSAIQTRSGWQMTVEAVLGVFSFQKINLYQDLATYQDLFAAHPIIAALGGGGSLSAPPAVITANELDDRVSPADTYQVIDADSSHFLDGLLDRLGVVGVAR